MSESPPRPPTGRRDEDDSVAEVEPRPTVTFIQPDGSQLDIRGTVGQSVMMVAVENLVPGIVGECGGEMSCATCHVFVDESWTPLLAARSATEIDMLDATSEEPTQHSRLSCQIRLDPLLHGLIVHVPISQR